MTGVEGPVGRVIRGVSLLARFRIEGLTTFGHTPQAFINSLAPMLGFSLAFTVPTLQDGAGWKALADFLASVVGLLAPAVMSYGFARLWRRDVLWLRYITAFNWMQAAVTLAMLPVLYGIGSLAGPNGRAVVLLPAFAATCYWLSLYWFLTRCGLELSRLRTTVAVFTMNFATGLLVLGPRALALAAAVPGPTAP